MVKHFLINFLSSASEYELAEDYWRTMLRDVAAEAGQSNEWRPWQTKTFLNGMPIPRDGNPILEARSERLARAIRIIQSPPESDVLEIGGWIDTFDYSVAGEPTRNEELVINLALSKEASEIARRLLRFWMDPSISREKIEDIIDDLCRESR